MSMNSAGSIAVFSDVHGNRHALEAALAAIDDLKVDRMICLGDVVGYGAFPNECIEILRERNIPTLAGNHDHAAIDRTDVRYFNEIARAAVEWTRSELSPDNRLWLAERPFTEVWGDFYFVHATPVEPEAWGYVLTYGDARIALESFGQKFGFIGHSHQPAVVEVEDEELRCAEDLTLPLPLSVGVRYLVNVGSVGQPRDRTPESCFVTVDADHKELRFHRVPYDVAAAQAAIRAAGLPEELALRIEYGF